MRYYLVHLHSGKRVQLGYWTTKKKAQEACARANAKHEYFRIEKGE